MHTDLLEYIKNDPAVAALTDRRKGLGGLNAMEEALIYSASFRSRERNLVIVKQNAYTAQQLYNRVYPLVKESVLLFTVEESLRVESVAASPSNYANQMEVLSQLCLDDTPHIIITHAMAIKRCLPSREAFRKHIVSLAPGETCTMEELKAVLYQSGYKQETRVDQPLTFSMRGGVVDVFSIQYEYPIRIEFFDDEIESIRFFDIATQRTIEKLDGCCIVPANALIHPSDFNAFRERVEKQLELSMKKANDPQYLKESVEHDLELLENHICDHYLYRYYSFFENTVSLLDYIDEPDVVLATPDEIETSTRLLEEENNHYIEECFRENKGLNYYSLFADFDRIVTGYHPYRISLLASADKAIRSNIRLAYFPLLPLEKMVEELARLARNHTVILSISEGQKELVEKEISALELSFEKELQFSDQQISEGFEYGDLIVLSEKELFGVKNVKGRYYTKFREAVVLDSYSDLKQGDYVVHNQYGIGRYDGIVQKTINSKHRDYLQIRYKDDDLLLVPLEQFKLVRKFVGSESAGVKLSKLGSSSWSKTKERISSEVNDMAARLIELYSQRENNIGFAFSKDGEEMRAFESNFPYQLTNDQVKAIAEVKYDMEQSKPMDRLLCGDVGFGKTEVAMVAAFKAICDLKQVAYLCPTTILSRQHFLTFVERFKGFPVKVALINRFVMESQQKEILKQLKEGKIDILIGTHRLLSSDVEFEDLGLLIIDEEQRFGVQAKEKIKELKKSIDVLSLSATPIPRTLQMSLTGVMSLSQLETAPQNRLPIQTYVVEKNEDLIKEVIQRELARDGQVFYLFNNISEIYQVARKIKMLVPDAQIAIGHGQMSRDELEDVMYRFVNGEYNVLICTTIIETGIDIPNANTMIIDNADHFGLAQLYQIRGRVGRSDRVAYAYFLYRSQKQLSEIASKRLQAIKEFTELGSGFKVAMRDLTIRGAGDLLGERQSGFINTVGMSLYLEMLNNAINRQKGISEEIVPAEQIRVNDIDGYIPQKFVPEDFEKITVYQKLDAIQNQQELVNYEAQLNDYYGKLPESMENLFEKKKIEMMLNTSRIAQYYQTDKVCTIELTKEFSDQVDGIKLFEKIGSLSRSIQLKYSQGKIALIFEKHKGTMEIVKKALEVIDQL